MIFSKRTLLMLSVSPFLCTVPNFLNSDEIVSRRLTNLQNSSKSTASNLSLTEIQKMEKDKIASLSNFDGRKLGIVTEPKNQGASNLCWAYTLASLAETSLLYKGVNEHYNNSNFEIDARKLDYDVNIRTKEADKLGLTTQDTFERRTNSANDVFERGQILLQQNSLNLTVKDKSIKKQAALVKNVINVKNDVDSIKNAIAEYGSVSLEYRMGQGENSYNYYAVSSYFDHASVIVGWDDSYSKDNFQAGNGEKPSRDGAWIVKNSWGPKYYNYGKDKSKFDNDDRGGYFYLSYDSKLRNVVALDVVNTNAYDNYYYYDGMGGFGSTNNVKDNTPVSVIFLPKKASDINEEVLKGITVGVIGSNTKLKVEVYENVKANNADRFSNYNNPTSGQLVHQEEFTVSQNNEEQGNYTLNFKNDIKLKPNSYFSIVVTPINGKLAFSSENKSTNDLSFYKDGEKWINTASGDDNAVANIKALTKNQSKESTKNNNDINYGKLDVKTNSLKYNGDKLNDYDVDFTLTLGGKNLETSAGLSVKKTLLLNDKVSKDGIIGSYHLELKGQNEYSGTIDYFIPIEKNSVLTPSFDENWKKENNKYTNIVQDSYEKQFNYSKDVKLPEDWDYVIPNETLFYGNNNVQIKYVGKDAKYYQNTILDVVIYKYNDKTTNINETLINLDKESYLYTGYSINPNINVSYQGRQLIENQDYRVDYHNNIDATNNASLTITGLKYFTGSISKTFTIEKVENKINSFEIKDGVPVVNANYGNNNVIYNYFEDKNCTKQLDDKPTKNGKYYVQATIPATQNYSESKSDVLEFYITNNKEQNNQKPSNKETNDLESSDQELNNQSISKPNMLPVIVSIPVFAALVVIGLSTFFIIKKIKNSSSKR